MKKLSKKYNCINCGVKVWNKDSRCKKCANKTKNNPNYIDNRTNKIYYCKDCRKEISIMSGFYGSGLCKSCCKKGKSLKSRIQNKYCIDCNKKLNKYKKATRCYSCENKKRWLNVKYQRKMVKAFNRKKNKWEQKLELIINELFPKEYKFVGDGKIFFDRFNPDFINCNGQKKIIELYGDYWHQRKSYIKRDKIRLKTYKKYGYKTLIIRDFDLKNIKVLEHKLKRFNQLIM